MKGMEESEADSETRGRGILTQRERKYYTKEGYIEEKSQEERSIRANIRRHLRNALFDFPIIMHNMEDRDIEQSLESDDGRLDEDIIHTIAFLYKYREDPDQFERDVERAIHKVDNVKDSSLSLDVDVDIDVEMSPQNSIIEKYENEGTGSLEPESLYELKEKGYLTETEFERELSDIFFPAYPKVLFDDLVKKLEDEMDSYDSLNKYADDLYDEYMEWVEKQREGRIIRDIPNEHRKTPFIDEEVYEEEGIGEMSEDELRELFGKGYAEQDLYVYDGEKIYRPMPPITEREPIVRERMED
jgi:hypothetical protein